MTDRELLAREVEKLVSSSVLHGSESLCKLLRYLAKQALDHPGVPVKEYQIATEVFGRPADFDPQSDSAIRVQAGRLRSKLSEYYAFEGTDDPIVVELPKGTYALSFHPRHGEAKRNGNGHVALPPDEPAVEPKSSRGWMIAFFAVSLVLISLLMFRSEQPSTRQNTPQETESVSPAFRAFWGPFMTGSEDPWVVFSNAAFVGRPETGIRYYDPSTDSSERIWDHYTGVGEVLAVHSLDQTFGLLHRKIRVKRGSLLSLDDVTNNDLIFVGSPSENLTLKDIPNTKDFVFQRIQSGPRKGDLAVVNLHPQPGEAQSYLATPFGVPLTEDYAIVSLMTGINQSHSVMILAGTTTFGTQGAVEFVSRQNSVRELLSRLDTADTSKVEPFEAVLHVKVARGVPLEAELVALRKH